MSLSEWADKVSDDVCVLKLKEAGYDEATAREWCENRPDKSMKSDSWWDKEFDILDPFGFLDPDGGKVYPTGAGPAADTSPEGVAAGEAILDVVEAAQDVVGAIGDVAAEVSDLVDGEDEDDGVSPWMGLPLVVGVLVVLYLVID